MVQHKQLLKQLYKLDFILVISNLVVLGCLLRVTTEKGRHFLKKKCTPEKFLATPMTPDG